MTSLQLPFDGSRPQVQISPAASPLPRPSSVASAHTPEMMTYAQPFRAFPPAHLALPLPHQSLANYPSTAPPMSFYPTHAPAPSSAGFWNPNVMRTVSHAHPMNSATEHASSRYSVSPQSAGANEAPPSAAYSMMAPPFTSATGTGTHIDPAVFNYNYSMSRSTSGASDTPDARLLTPHFDYREQFTAEPEPELRRVGDVLAQGHAQGGGKYRGFESGLGQPAAFRAPISADRDVKPDIHQHQTEYEREREAQIIHNRKLLDDVGLGGEYMRSASRGHPHTQARKVTKRSFVDEHPSRVSSRIASMHRTSYADLDGIPSESEDEYEEVEEDDFRPPKRTKGGAGKRGGGFARQSSYAKLQLRPKVELSLYGLLQIYPQIPHVYPLFYYTLNNDLTINSDSIPLIGSIPSTCTPLEKGESLQNFFHRGRRVLAQLDSFTSRCDRKYEASMERWSELDFHTRIAIRDVRRKVVERCENYKYTRRDLLDKVLGKNKWQPIEQGLVEWHLGGEGDPANDLQNVTLTLPTPPVYVQPPRHLAPTPMPFENALGRTIRPFPSRARVASAAPPTARTVSVQMGSSPPLPMGSAGTYYPTHTPLYGEDQVPVSVQMPGTAATSSTLTPMASAWEGGEVEVKRGQSESAEST